jgi:hypothetical protein
VRKIFAGFALAAVLTLTVSAPAIVAQDSKVVICHIPPGNPDNAHDIEVSSNAVPAHLAHGDSLGSCDGPPPPPPPPDGCAPGQDDCPRTNP